MNDWPHKCTTSTDRCSGGSALACPRALAEKSECAAWCVGLYQTERTRADGAGMLSSAARQLPIPVGRCSVGCGGEGCSSLRVGPLVVAPPLLLLLPVPRPGEALPPSVRWPISANADKGSRSTTTPPSPFPPASLLVVTLSLRNAMSFVLCSLALARGRPLCASN